MLESSLLWKIFERNKGGKIYSSSGYQRVPSVMVGRVKGNSPCDGGQDDGGIAGQVLSSKAYHSDPLLWLGSTS